MPQHDLGALGWSPELAEQLQPGLAPGRVIAAHRAAFDVHTADGAVRTRLPGRLVHDSTDVAVGDWVGLGDGLIRVVLPRRSAIVRSAAGRTSQAQTLAANEHHQTVKITGAGGALWASWSGAIDRTLHPTFSLKHFDGATTTDGAGT